MPPASPQAAQPKAAPANAAAAKRGPGRPPKGTDTGLRVREMAVADLVVYARNARTHSDASVAKLARLIAEFGFTNPILVAGKDILAGHARRLAAIKLGLETVPTIDLSRLSKVQRRAYILADNRAALDAGWDEGLLLEELEELRADEFDLSLTAFDLGELADLLGDPDGVAETETADKAEETPIKCPSCGHEFTRGGPP